MVRPASGTPLGASYRLVRLIGSGAAGDVWTAHSITDDTIVAAKILKPEHASSPELVERFIRERSVLLGLKHPHIVAIRDLIVEGDTLAIVMDFIAGGSLREVVTAHGPLAPSDALNVCAQVLDALARAHGQQITHRDIKPDNVLLTREWEPGVAADVRVADFGIASVVSERRRETTGLLGTPRYMAPELISHGHASPATDVYSTGVMLYELLAGRTPFAGPGTDFSIAYRHVTALPPRLELPRTLWTELDRLLAKDPRERPSAADAASTLRRLATKHEALPALAPSAEAASFEESDRPATMLRSDLLQVSEAANEHDSPSSADAPVLGEASQQTMLRPMQKLTLPAPTAAPDETGTVSRRRAWMRPKAMLLAGSGATLVAALVVGGLWIFGADAAPPEVSASETLTANQQDTPLPTGLTTARTATYDPDAQTVTVELTYTAQKAALAGPLLEVIPGAAANGSCPGVTWEDASGSRHQASTTGLTAQCGWKLDDVTIPANGRTTVSATIPLDVPDHAALQEWLDDAAAATNAALSDPTSVSTVYPAQRLTAILVKTPPRLVSQTPLMITLIPVWPSGPDELNPLYQSPAAGTPSQMLRQVAGGEAGIRFSDNCAGAIAISTDGLVATALSVTPDCQLRAQVGNFTDLESPSFAITTRE